MNVHNVNIILDNVESVEFIDRVTAFSSEFCNMINHQINIAHTTKFKI
jgi:hypothetical protein